jgi:anti-anti-sigma factor
MVIDYLEVTVEPGTHVCELTVSGELDACVAGRFADAAMEAVRTATGPVLVDLSGLEFMDVSGARSLAAVIRVITPRRAGLRSCRPPVRRVLELLGLDVDGLSVGMARDFEARELIARSREISAYLASGANSAGKVLDDLAGSYAHMACQRQSRGQFGDAERLRARSRATREHAKRLQEDGISGSTDTARPVLALVYARSRGPRQGLPRTRWAARTKLSPAIPAGW